MPAVVVVRGRGPNRLLAHASFVDTLERKLRSGGRPIIVIEFDAAAHEAVEAAARVVRAFGDAADVELAFGAIHARATMSEVQAKLLARSSRQTSDALAEAREVVRATAVLRSRNGRLSAKAIADALGISVSGLAAVLETSRQRIAKTPDSKALQKKLAPFERVCRLMAAITRDEFFAWLRQANTHLDDLPPLEVIERGQVDVVADLVEDMVTGRPS